MVCYCVDNNDYFAYLSVRGTMSNNVIDVITAILILFLLVISVFSIYQTLYVNSPMVTEPQKTVTTETLIPTHVAKCTETTGHVCTTYTIYRVTTP